MNKTSKPNKPNYFLTQTNSLGMTLVEYNSLKRYFSGVTSLRWAFQEYLKKKSIHQEYLKKKSIQELVRTKEFQQLHHKILLPKEGTLILKKSLPREPIKEDVKLKAKSILFKDKKYSAKQFWEGLLKNTDKLLNKGYIFNLYSNIGEQGLLAGSVLTNAIVENSKGTLQNKLKYKITTGAKLDYDFKDFNDYDSSVSKLANTDILTIFSYNTLSSSDFNKAKFESLLDECNIKNNLVILTSKKELKIKDKEIINIGFTDSIQKETDLLSDLFGED